MAVPEKSLSAMASLMVTIHLKATLRMPILEEAIMMITTPILAED